MLPFTTALPAPLGYLCIPASSLRSTAGQVGQVLSAALSLVCKVLWELGVNER